MSDMSALAATQIRFGATLLDVSLHNERRAYISIDKKDAPSVCRYLYEEQGGRLATASGIDMRSGIEILYHFMIPRDHQLITLKIKVEKPAPETGSCGDFLPAAIWIERELNDILGVTFTGHPDPRRLIMSDDWPEGVYPFRRDFKEPAR